MTQKERQLLLKDLCARLPYGVICKASIQDLKTDTPPEEVTLELTSGMLNYLWIDYRKLKPYLRPMSSMSEEELNELEDISCLTLYPNGTQIPNGKDYDWLNAHHFDYRGLIEKGLALEAPESMYK